MEWNLRAYVAELVGTFALVFVSAGVTCANYLAAVAWQPPPPPPEHVIVQPQPGLVGIALATGFIYAAALAAGAGPNGGFLNPVIPLVLWVCKRMDTARAAALIGLQLLGAVLAGGLLRFVFSFRADVMTAAELGTPHLNLRAFDPSASYGWAWSCGAALELALTLVLTAVIFATFLDPRAAGWMGQGYRRWACLWCGLTLAACTLVAFPVTGAGLNPARWLGTVVWEQTIPSLQLQRPFRDHIVYWFGPIVGALIAGGIYSGWVLPAQESASLPAPASAPPSTGVTGTLFRSRK